MYPATADRIGALGLLAADVTAFYTALEWVRVRVNILGSVSEGNCPRRASCAWVESERDSRISEILIQPVGWAEASRRWQSRIRKTCVTA